MIFWTGLGILAPFIVAAGIFGFAYAADAFFGPGYAHANHWVAGAGFAVGGLLCLIIGRWLYGRESRVFVDKASGREFRAGASHTFMFIPMTWLGVLAMLGAIPVGIYGIPESSRSKRKRAEAEVLKRLEHRPDDRSSNPATSANPPTPPAPPKKFASVAEAQEAAMQRYPTLSIAGSDFNKAFVELHKKYQQERSDMLKENDWPLRIADEVAKSRQ